MTLPSTQTCLQPPREQIRLFRGRAVVFRHAADVPSQFWERGFSDTPKDFAYYSLIEQSMAWPFEFRYLALFDELDRPIALQPLILATQDLAAAAGKTFARPVARLRTHCPNFLETRMIFAGCLVGEGRTGTIESLESVVPSVAEALEKYAAGQGVSLVAFKDFPAAMRSPFSCLNRAGYIRIAGFPSLSLTLNFGSFDEYIATRLSKNTRKNLRRKLRAADEASPALSLEVLTDAEEIIDEIYPLYLAVVQTSAVRFETFSRDYFLKAARLAPGRFRYFVWRQGDRAVAFSFCTIWEGTLYDNDIGLDYAVAYELNLYYLTFRDLLEWALANGLKRYASAPFNYEPKLRLGLELQPLDVYVKHTSLLLNPVIKMLARFFEPARIDPILRRQLHLLR